MKRPKIAYVTAYDAQDVSNWSGTGYYIAKTLEKHVGDVTYIGNLHPRTFVTNAVKRLWYHRFTSQSFDESRTALTGHAYAAEVERQLKGKSFDVIFSPGTIPIAYLETKTPIAFWTDATFHGRIGFYHTDLSAETIRDGNTMEQSALDRSALAIYSSDWAAASATGFYKADPKKVAVVCFGANVSDVPPREQLRHSPTKSDLQLLFVGKDWERKRGHVAFETLVGLNARGIRASLTVVGCVPPAPFTHERMTVIPYLDKNRPEDAARLRQLYIDCDFFLMPSRMDCSPIVLCEAAAFGVPSVTTSAGGIPTLVPDGVTGFTLAPEDGGDAYATKILETIETPGAYERLGVSARDRYEGMLNWDAAGRSLQRLIGAL